MDCHAVILTTSQMTEMPLRSSPFSKEIPWTIFDVATAVISLPELAARTPKPCMIKETPREPLRQVTNTRWHTPWWLEMVNKAKKMVRISNGRFIIPNSFIYVSRVHARIGLLTRGTEGSVKSQMSVETWSRCWLRVRRLRIGFGHRTGQSTAAAVCCSAGLERSMGLERSSLAPWALKVVSVGWALNGKGLSAQGLYWAD